MCAGIRKEDMRGKERSGRGEDKKMLVRWKQTGLREGRRPAGRERGLGREVGEDR